MNDEFSQDGNDDQHAQPNDLAQPNDAQVLSKSAALFIGVYITY